jgi:hypothetical protein
MAHPRKLGSLEPVVDSKFAVGDLVHDEQGLIGTVDFIRKDDFVCVLWPSGTREWRKSSDLCGPLEW